MPAGDIARMASGHDGAWRDGFRHSLAEQKYGSSKRSAMDDPQGRLTVGITRKGSWEQTEWVAGRVRGEG